MSSNTTCDASTTTDLTNYDVIILSHADLNAFVTAIGGPDSLPESVTVFTDDDQTRNTVEFNLIAFNGDTGNYGIATQLHQPISNDDRVLDLRNDAPTGFADYIQGLA